MAITSNKELKQFFQDNKYNLYGVGLNTFSRAISQIALGNYSIIALRNSLETSQISNKINSFVLEDVIADKVNEMNTNAFSILDNEYVQSYLNKTKNNYILSYSGRKDFEGLCSKNGWISAIGSAELGIKFLENKVKFREFLNDININNHPLSISTYIDEINYEEITKKLGKNIVLQVPLSGGGRGTFFINNQEEFDNKITNTLQFLKDEKSEVKSLLVSKFVKGRSASISLVATRWGTFVSPIQYQISDIYDLVPIEKGNGVFIGHDWTASQKISKGLNEKAYQIGQILGDSIYKLGFRGFFGLDILIDEESNELNIIECNSRLTAVMPTLDMIQERSDSPLFFALHFLEYIVENEKLDIGLDYKNLQEEISKKKQGSHFHFYSRNEKTIKVEFEFKPGVYKLDVGELKFIRDGFSILDLESQDEFIITELPTPDTTILKYGVMGRILTLSNVLEVNGDFTKWGKDIARAVYSATKVIN